MTRVIWKSIKDKVIYHHIAINSSVNFFFLLSNSVRNIDIFLSFLMGQLILPFLELDIKYYDLGLPYRDETDDKVTIESAEATLKYVICIP